jgi:Uma2 family endonuclease
VSEMSERGLLTAEQFAECKFDLPDGGRWVELVAGDTVSLQPPEASQGAAVLNVSKALAECLGESNGGYACYELGLIVARQPDTVRCPPVSVFTGGPLFAESDKVVTDARPSLAIEIASTPDRMREARRRVKELLDWGVVVVWLLEPQDESVIVFHDGRTLCQLSREDVLDSEALPAISCLSAFRLSVAEVFAAPDWWSGTTQRATG